MEILVTISIFINGITIGILALDFWTRRGQSREWRTTLEKIQGVHNQQVSQLADLVDKVNTHEFKLTGVKK